MTRAPTTTVTVDYEAVSAVGETIATFGTPEQAGAWAEEKADRYPRCRIDVVTTKVRRETLFEQAPPAATSPQTEPAADAA